MFNEELELEMETASGPIVYAIDVKVGNKRLWDTVEAKFVDSVPEDKREVYLCTAEGDDSVDYLVKTLEFYGLPLGELADYGLSASEILVRTKTAKVAEFDAAMAAVDAKLIRPLANGETDRVDALNAVQERNRELRALALAATTVEEVQAISPVTLESEE